MSNDRFGSEFSADLLNAVKSVASGNQEVRVRGSESTHDLQIGDRVRVTEGPVSGQYGSVTGFKSTGMSQVQIELGRSHTLNNNDIEYVSEALDPVNKKAVKKKFDDREDKDLDNDGDEDESDRFLHKRRKAVSKSMSKKGNGNGNGNGKGEKVEINPEVEEVEQPRNARIVELVKSILKQGISEEEEEAEDIDEITQAQLDQAKKEGKFTKLPPRVARGARKKQTMRLKGGRPGAKELADRAEKKVSKSMGEESEVDDG